jgi:hypothetical protein
MHMESPAVPKYSKEIVDLLMRIKKHLKVEHGTEVKLSDTRLLDKLAVFKAEDDQLLKGMLSYLMALAGPEWTRYYEKNQKKDKSSAVGDVVKKTMTFYRGAAVETEEKSDNASTSSDTIEERKPIRYYRGQPIYE